MCFQVIRIRHLSIHSIHLQIFGTMIIRHYLDHPLSPNHSFKTLSSHKTSKVSYQHDAENFGINWMDRQMSYMDDSEIRQWKIFIESYVCRWSISLAILWSLFQICEGKCFSLLLSHSVEPLRASAIWSMWYGPWYNPWFQIIVWIQKLVGLSLLYTFVVRQITRYLKYLRRCIIDGSTESIIPVYFLLENLW